MKYQSTNTNQVYSVEFKTGKQICPECSHLRKKKNDKCLNYAADKNVAYCHNCNTTFFEYRPHEAKVYVIPEWKNETNLTDKAVKYFNSRMIKQQTLNEMKIYSTTEWMPQFGKEVDVICFPYFFRDALINVKFRGPKKSFKMVSGAELIFWNLDAVESNKEIIITEGEMDALTFIDRGIKNVISVPNGANKGQMSYLDDYIHLFDDIQTVYLATDQDTKGIELRDEFIRRFGPERCKIISFKDCKDANEYAIDYPSEFSSLVENAKDVPINGAVSVPNIEVDIRDFFNEGFKPGESIKIPEVDKYITWERKRLAIVTGVPGSGKSEFVDFIVSRLNLLHGWKAAYFTPENYPLKYHYAKIYEKFIGKKFSKKNSTEVEYDQAYEHIKNNFFWILNEEDLTLESILEVAKYYVKQKGIKVLVIDPYNKIDHQYDAKTSETNYISRFLDKLIMFGKLNDLLIFLVAHPRKMDRGSVPTLYDISGSANFYNKTDYGFTVHRTYDERNLMTNEIEIHIQKIKFKNLGEQGVSVLKYNYNNGRFDTGTVDQWDDTNWLSGRIDTVVRDNFFNIETDEVPF